MGINIWHHSIRGRAGCSQFSQRYGQKAKVHDNGADDSSHLNADDDISPKVTVDGSGGAVMQGEDYCICLLEARRLREL
ncbi:hypothetical protein [Pseudomonas sp.]|uniref:hypothetical protein n=1 Tax=Pseudomonas sp. TaxID=306 RepID=UPI002610C32B|nr:hypothetical protein [Pseudomonas sp.]